MEKNDVNTNSLVMEYLKKIPFKKNATISEEKSRESVYNAIFMVEVQMAICLIFFVANEFATVFRSDICFTQGLLFVVFGLQCILVDELVVFRWTSTTSLKYRHRQSYSKNTSRMIPVRVAIATFIFIHIFIVRQSIWVISSTSSKPNIDFFFLGTVCSISYILAFALCVEKIASLLNPVYWDDEIELSKIYSIIDSVEKNITRQQQIAKIVQCIFNNNDKKFDTTGCEPVVVDDLCACLKSHGAQIHWVGKVMSFEFVTAEKDD